jgi:hypothetical protein
MILMLDKAQAARNIDQLRDALAVWKHTHFGCSRINVTQAPRRGAIKQTASAS